MSEPEAVWTEVDQARADLIAEIACEISESEDVVAMALDAYDARRDGFLEHLDAIIAGLTPNERTEFSGYVYEGRAETIESLKAKGLLFSLDRSTPLGGAVSYRLSWLAARAPAKASQQADTPQEALTGDE